MAIIYTYPTKSNPVSGDLLLMSDSADNNTTKQATISSIKDTIDVVDSLAATLPIQVSGSTGTITISSRAYGGSGTTGYVPAGGTTTTFLKGNGSFSNINLSTDVTGTLIVENGGTGFTDFASVGMLMYSDSASTMAKLAIGDPGLVLKVNSAGNAPEWTSDTDTTYTAGDGLILSGSNEFKVGLKVNGGLVIESTKVAVDLGASSITGTLAAADGGTGLTSISTLQNSNAAVTSYTNGTSERVVVSSGASSINAYSNMTYNGAALKLSGSLGTAPTTTSPLNISYADGTASSEAACINLDFTGPQGSRGIIIDLDQYNTGIETRRTSTTNTQSAVFKDSSGVPIGSISHPTASSTAFNTTSDYRLKENIVEMTGAVDRLKQLKPNRFNFKSTPEHTVDGFLAHEVSNVVPECITGEKDGIDFNGDPLYQGIDQSKLVPLLVGAIKELTARIEALES